ncbi:MAG TPA: nuclear transport factor 2 family protein [Tepidisphaeraceae bacterium]|nr:nuclear transport factor 2 family protein [Tepidisphaeraceae bacterium]
MSIDPNLQPQQAVLATLHALNRAWTTGHVEDLATYFHKDMVAIVPTMRHRLEGRDACIAGWKSFVDIAKIHAWREIDPEVHLYGQTAIVTYYYDLFCEIAGQSLHLTGRDMFVFVQEAGRWWAVADQFSSDPTSAA